MKKLSNFVFLSSRGCWGRGEGEREGGGSFQTFVDGIPNPMHNSWPRQARKGLINFVVEFLNFLVNIIYSFMKVLTIRKCLTRHILDSCLTLYSLTSYFSHSFLLPFLLKPFKLLASLLSFNTFNIYTPFFFFSFGTSHTSYSILKSLPNYFHHKHTHKLKHINTDIFYIQTTSMQITQTHTCTHTHTYSTLCKSGRDITWYILPGRTCLLKIYIFNVSLSCKSIYENLVKLVNNVDLVNYEMHTDLPGKSLNGWYKITHTCTLCKSGLYITWYILPGRTCLLKIYIFNVSLSCKSIYDNLVELVNNADFINKL